MKIKTHEKLSQKLRVPGGLGESIFKSNIFGYQSHEFSVLRSEKIEKVPPKDLFIQGVEEIPPTFDQIFQHLREEERMVYPCVTEQYVPMVIRLWNSPCEKSRATLLCFSRFINPLGKPDIRGLRITFPKKEKPSVFLYEFTEKTNWIHTDTTFLLLPEPIEITTSKGYQKELKKMVKNA